MRFSSPLPLLLSSLALALAKTAIIVPLYNYPTDPEWSTIQASIAANPDTTFELIINPNSGPVPVSSEDYSSFLQGISAIRSAAGSNKNVLILGYVHTSYGARAQADVNADTNEYASWAAAARPDGIFFDEAAEAAANVTYYKAVAANAKASAIGSHALIVLNPGTVPEVNTYFKYANQIVIHEQSWADYAMNGPIGISAAASQFSVIVYSMPNDATLQKAVTNLTGSGYGSIYLTNDGDSYKEVGTDWKTFVAKVNAANEANE